MNSDKPQAVASDALFGVWMPIETAPHDDATWVLVCGEDGEVNIAIFGRHYLDVQNEMPLCWTDGISRELQPTHWMPLPDPPNPGLHRTADLNNQ